MTNSLTQISAKLLFFFVFAYLYFACGQKKNESKVVDNQGDIANLSNKTERIMLSDSIMQLIIANKTDSLKAEQAAFFTQKIGNYSLHYTLQQANLDSTISNEIILFASYTDLDSNDTIYFPDNEVYFFRKIETKWQVIGQSSMYNPMKLDLHHSIDTLHQLVILQNIGRGSGYGAIFNEFYKIQADTLAYLLTIPDKEYSNGIHYQFNETIHKKAGFYTANVLESTYKVINNSNIQVNYHYHFWVEMEHSKEKKISLLNTYFTLNYEFDKQQYRFLLLPNQKIGSYVLSNQDDIVVDGFADFYTDTLKLLAKTGNKQQKYYLKHFDFDKYKK
jgi:hypothetical protein